MTIIVNKKKQRNMIRNVIKAFSFLYKLGFEHLCVVKKEMRCSIFILKAYYVVEWEFPCV